MLMHEKWSCIHFREGGGEPQGLHQQKQAFADKGLNFR